MSAARLVPLLALLHAAPFTPSATAQTLQQAIDAASPGDTVFVAPGDYTRPVTVETAVTLFAVGPGDARLAGLAGSAARVEGLVFDGTLGEGGESLVTAGAGLTLARCAFRNGIRGVLVTAGAGDVTLTACTFLGLLEGVALEDAGGTLLVVDSAFEACDRGILGGALPPADPPPRHPAARCEEGPCGRVEIASTRFTGGRLPMDLAGPLVLALRDVETAGTDTALVARGLRLEIQDARFTGPVSRGVGLLLVASSGFLHRTQVSDWAVGVRVEDLGNAYSDLVLGGTQETGGDIAGSPVNLHLEQPEWIDAEYNFWGSLDCALVATTIVGQKVRILVTENHQQGVVCTLERRPATWGRLKERWGAGRP